MMLFVVDYHVHWNLCHIIWIWPVYSNGKKNVAVSAAIRIICMLAKQNRNGLQMQTSTVRSVPFICSCVLG